MALSRPYVLVLLAAVLGVATLFSLQSASQSASAKNENAAPVVTNAPGPATTAPGASKPAAPSAQPAAKPKPEKPAKPDPGVPPRVKRALESGSTVVLFFRQPAADDDAVAKAVAGLKGAKHVTVFSDGLANISRYRRVAGSLGITQAPAVVVVNKNRKAQLIEGYVDPESLRQQVEDAR